MRLPLPRDLTIPIPETRLTPFDPVPSQQRRPSESASSPRKRRPSRPSQRRRRKPARRRPLQRLRQSPASTPASRTVRRRSVLPASCVDLFRSLSSTQADAMARAGRRSRCPHSRQCQDGQGFGRFAGCQDRDAPGEAVQGGGASSLVPSLRRRGLSSRTTGLMLSAFPPSLVRGLQGRRSPLHSTPRIASDRSRRPQEEQLPILKKEHPGLRLNQYRPSPLPARPPRRPADAAHFAQPDDKLFEAFKKAGPFRARSRP